MSYSQKFGLPIVSVADAVDKTADINLSYPNGSGKAEGMPIYVTTAAGFVIYVANGAAPTDDWTEQAGGTAITPV